MQKVKMAECEFCGKKGEELSLLQANHKDLGQIMVCQECWEKLWLGNRTVCGTTGSSGTCPSCR